MPDESMRERITRNEHRLNRHSERLHSLERYQSRNEVLMEQMVEQIQNLANSIKWGTTTIIITLIGFFIWYIQSL